MMLFINRSYAFIVLTFVFCVSCSVSEKKQVIQPQYRDITESVYASVKVVPSEVYYPQPLRNGIIDKIFINEGDLVQAGQPLFHIEPTSSSEGQYKNAYIGLEEARLNYLGKDGPLKKISLEIENTKNNLKQDSVNWMRQKRLVAQNIGTKSELEQLKLKYENSVKQLGILQQQYKQTQLNLRSSYQKAKNLARTEQNNLDDFKIRSKVGGKVYQIRKEVGDFIGIQEKFAEIGNDSNYIIEMSIDEVDISKINIGDSVLIILNAYPEKVFVASITFISPKKDELTQTFRVESVFLKPPPQLYYGLSGEANIIISRKSDVMVIPSEYLSSSDQVFTKNGEKRVKVGVKNLDFVEIISGLDTSDILIKEGP